MKKLILILLIMSLACPVIAEEIDIKKLPYMKEIQARHEAMWDEIDQVMLDISTRKSMIEYKHKNEAIDQETYKKQMAALRDEFLKHKAEWKKESDSIDFDGYTILKAHGYNAVRHPTSDLPNLD